MYNLYKKNTELTEAPYLDNCYYSETQEDPSDTLVTTPEAWIEFWQMGALDFKTLREAFKTWVANQGGFTSLSMHYKELASHYYVATPAEIITYLTVDLGMSNVDSFKRRMECGVFFDTYARQARIQRYDKLYVFIRNAVNFADLDDIANDLETFMFRKTYIEYGREGTMKTSVEGIIDEPGILDYIAGTNTWVLSLLRPSLMSRLNNAPVESWMSKQDIIDNAYNIIDIGYCQFNN